MAITLDINLISESLIDLKDLIEYGFCKKFDIKLEDMIYMDNWNWENIRFIYDIANYGKVLEKGKIVVVNLKSNKLKDLGIYIVKTEKEYVYNLWINTEGYPELDADVISFDNERFYKKTYYTLGEIIKKLKIKLKTVSIGMEAELEYDENIYKIIERSDNMVVWIVEDGVNLDHMLHNYIKSKAEEMDAVIYERRIN